MYFFNKSYQCIIHLQNYVPECLNVSFCNECFFKITEIKLCSYWKAQGFEEIPPKKRTIEKITAKYWNNLRPS